MNISDESKKLIEEINDYSERPLLNNFEASVIIQSAFSSDNSNFKDIIFTAKYIKGLKHVLSNRIINNDKYMEGIFEEFNKNVQKFIELLRLMINDSDEKIRAHFEKKYFVLDQASMQNVMTLTDDLALCKEYFNANKNKFFNTDSGV